MLKILVLEDEQYRINWFKRNTIGYNVHYSKTVKEAIDYLKDNEYDIIYLDCDLNEDAYNNYKKGVLSDKDNGYEVCLWLKDHPESNKGAKFIVHSLNDLAQPKMTAALADRNAQQIQFYKLVTLAGVNS